MDFGHCLRQIWYSYKILHLWLTQYIDLIHVWHLPDDKYQWILHAVDDWFKFNFAYPLESKHASGVSVVLNSHLFPYFAVPRSSHSENGHQLINNITDRTLKSWHSDIQLVSGQPQHPQSHGLVECACYTLQQEVSAEVSVLKTKSSPWASGLPHILCKLLLLCMFHKFCFTPVF